jgi:hypothetical protein
VGNRERPWALDAQTVPGYQDATRQTLEAEWRKDGASTPPWDHVPSLLSSGEAMALTNVTSQQSDSSLLGSILCYLMHTYVPLSLPLFYL